MATERTEHRVVESADPGLTPEANRLLTQEMREIVGADEVDVPSGTPDHGHERHKLESPDRAALDNVRWELVVTGFVIAIALGVAAVETGSVVFLVVLFALVLVGLATTLRTIRMMTNETEHADPQTAARLEAEGVGDPDALLSELVEDLPRARRV